MRRRSDIQGSAPPRNRPFDYQRRTLLHRPYLTFRYRIRQAAMSRFADIRSSAAANVSVHLRIQPVDATQ